MIEESSFGNIFGLTDPACISDLLQIINYSKIQWLLNDMHLLSLCVRNSCMAQLGSMPQSLSQDCSQRYQGWDLIWRLDWGMISFQAYSRPNVVLFPLRHILTGIWFIWESLFGSNIQPQEHLPLLSSSCYLVINVCVYVNVHGHAGEHL